MALRTPLSVTPHLYMGDSTGRPLDKGVVYFGEQDKDPEFYPINLFSDDALTKPLAQPVHTKGGYLYDKGDMVEPHAKELIYSVKVLDSYGRKVFYKGAMMRNSWNDDVIEQINTAIIGSADVARQVATDITNDAINNTAIEGGVLADTFVVVDGSLSQRTINKGLESIADLSTIKNPKDGLRVYVKSYHAGLGIGGGYFVYDSTKANVNNSGTVINGWVREFKNVVSIVDFGGHSAATAIESATALNKALAACKIVVIPVGDFNLAPDIVKINSKNRLYCYGQLIGTETDMSAKADLAGVYINASGVDDFEINTVNIRNGYRGIGINVAGCKNFTINKPVVDGFTFGIRIAEQDYKVENSQGCQNFTVNKPVIKNTRYWGLYIRSLNITDETKKTKNFKVVKPSFYNCHMAGFVAAEGNVKNFVLDNPYFDRCNVSMHFESASNYTVINPRDNDTGKKPDHLQANSEYPFVDWSLYQCFVEDSKVIGGNLCGAVEHMATKGGECKDIHYTNLTAKTFIFEGSGSDKDTAKNFFDNIALNQCTSTKELIYQQPTDAPLAYICDLKVVNCVSHLAGDGNGNAVAVSIPRGVNIKVNDNTFDNACLRITASGILSVKNNTWLTGTDNTQSIFDGTDGSLGAGNFGEITGNTFTRAGGAVIGGSAILVKNFTKIRVDNTIRGNGVNYGYELRNNYRIELGAGLTYDTLQGEYVESGTTSLVHLYK